MHRFPATLLALSLLGPVLADPPAGPADKRPANRLARETSPYLLLHAHNPVDWYPWGPEAFEKARKENKLVFLSIGYSSCYWCHVMERQSFANADIAKLMNEWFVCIKVDREERPDVDQVYMTALQVQGSRGGWPLSMFLLADGKPLGGGTYWPPEDRAVEGGDEKLPGFKTILTRVHDDWLKRPAELKEAAGRLAEGVQDTLAATRKPLPITLDRDLVKAALTSVGEEFDAEHGGFGNPARGFRGAKFPQAPVLVLLLAEAQRSTTPPAAAMLRTTLDRMARGGLFDQLGGGFHRYTVDREWKVPHFEKMLYDNAQLVSVYSRAFKLDPQPAYRRVVEETLAFVARELTSPEGAFYCALDAESEGEEGKFYVWTAKEIDGLLPAADAAFVKRAYGLDAGPNFEGKANVLLLPKPPAELAQAEKLTEAQWWERLRPLREKLLQARSKRARPLLDTKVLTGWNGLMIAGYAEAGMAFGQPAYVTAAAKAAAFLLATMKGPDGRLKRTWSAPANGAGGAKIDGYLEDYALLINGLLTLHEATKEARWLTEAKGLAETLLTRFADAKMGGFYFTAADGEALFVRAKDQFDGATPSGNSAAALALARLATGTGEGRFAEAAERTFQAMAPALKQSPENVATLVDALDRWLELKGRPGK